MLTRSLCFAGLCAVVLYAAGGCGGTKIVASGEDAGAGGGSSAQTGGDLDGGSGGGSAGGGAGGGNAGGAGGGSGGGAAGGGAGGGDIDAGSPPDAGVIVRFIAVGDTGKQSVDQQAVADAMTAKCAADGCDFVVMLGDNIYPSGCSSTTDPQWQDKFETQYAALNVPFYAVLGNHDYGGDGAGTEFSKGQVQVDYSNVSTKWKMPAKFYRMTHGDVEFFAGDSNMQMFHSDDDQRAAFPLWLSQSTAKWKIYLSHHPYKSNGPHGNAGSYDGASFVYIVNGKGVRDFYDDILCGRVDVALAGHDHSRQWLTDKCQNTELIVSGAGGSTTTIKGSQPVHYQSATVGFVYFTIQGNKLTGEFVNAQGTSEYTRTITK